MPNDLTVPEKLSPAMAALPRPAMREFVRHLFDPDLNGRGRFVDAARRAGYTGDPATVGRTAQRLLRHPLVIAAMKEIGDFSIRHMLPDAINAQREIVNDPEHKDRLKASNVILDRSIGAIAQKHEHAVTVEVDYRKIDLLELREDLRNGANEEYLIAKYGGGAGGYHTLLGQIQREDRERTRAGENVVEGEFEVIADEKAIIEADHNPGTKLEDWMS